MYRYSNIRSLYSRSVPLAKYTVGLSSFTYAGIGHVPRNTWMVNSTELLEVEHMMCYTSHHIGIKASCVSPMTNPRIATTS